MQFSFLKRWTAAALVAALLCLLSPSVLAAQPSLDNFTRSRTYLPGQFSDVAPDAWYAAGVQDAYELGLMVGTSSSSFDPEGNITVLQTLIMAARLHKIYYAGNAQFDQSGDPWYSSYLSYGRDNGLHTLSDGDPYLFEAADRLTFGSILAEALPSDTLPAINSVAVIPDLPRETTWSAADEIYLLYNAGVLTGFDEYGTFHPDQPIDRAAVATIVARIAVPKNRVQFTLTVDGPLLFVYFLDVGQGDAIYLECEDAAMLIDGGTPSQSNKIYSFLQARGIDDLDYLVSTHPHDDHAGGLSGALHALPVKMALTPTLDTGLSSGKGFDSFLKTLTAQGVPVTIPTAGDSFSLGPATVDVLGPISEGETNANNLSLVLKVTLEETSFLFTGDAEREEEAAILATGADLSCDVLKVGHHGSNSSTSYPFLWHAQPKYAVISVGTDNQYGHPTEAVLSRLQDAGVTTYRTDLQGDIAAISDGKDIYFVPAKSGEAPLLPTATAEYVVNKNTNVFHRTDCTSVGRMSEKNKEYFTGTRTELIERGCTPCGVCQP